MRLRIGGGDEGAVLDGFDTQSTLHDESLAHVRPTNSLSYEFLSRAELESLTTEMKKGLSTLDLSHLYTVALAQNGSFEYVLFIWNAGYLFRKKAKLGSYPLFALPVSEQREDNFQPRLEDILSTFNPQELGVDLLDHLAFALLHAQQPNQALRVATTLAQKEPMSFRGWLRLGDMAFKMGCHKLAMLAYGRILSLQDVSTKVRSHALERIIASASYTEWSHIFLRSEMNQLPSTLHSLLLEAWSDEVREEVSDSYPNSVGSQWETREPLYLFGTSEDSGIYALPPHFRWLVPFRVAIAAVPSDISQIRNLSSSHVGIRHLILLNDRSHLNEEWVQHLKRTYVPMHGMRTPTLEQIDCIMDSLTDSQQLPTLICSSESELTAVVAACYLVAYGFGPTQADQTTPAMQVSEAISALNPFHTFSIRSPEQEDAVTRWERNIWKRNSVTRVAPREPPPCSLEIIGELPPDADLLLLVGLQGKDSIDFKV
jgi:atypical dual specificity phosphatase